MTLITFKFKDDEREIEITLMPKSVTHTEITACYMDFLRAAGFMIPYVTDPDICDLALD